jgi:hypothetical protein
VNRIFMAIVGVIYILLAVWCSLVPQKTSKAVGLDLQPGQGQSEFLTVYGGLQIALGFVFLWPVYRPEEVNFSLFLCLTIHGCLVLFRTASFFLYKGFSTTTYFFALTEWIVFLGAAILSWRKM